MKTFDRMAAQGDVVIVKLLPGSIPPGAEKVKAEDGQVIVAHSETGHHHVMDSKSTEMYRLPESIYECFLEVSEPTELKHLRDTDTHESILFTPGTYKVFHQREYTPEGLTRLAAD